jgi:hypothetical protein
VKILVYAVANLDLVEQKIFAFVLQRLVYAVQKFVLFEGIYVISAQSMTHFLASHKKMW